MPLDPSKPLSQAQIKAGTTLFEAGQPARMLCLVHQGEVSIFNARDAAQPRRMYPIGANSSPGFSSLILKEQYPFRIVATKDSLISAFPVNPQGAFTALILGKLNVGMLAVRSLLQEILMYQASLAKHNEFMSIAGKSLDNMAIVYNRCNPDAFKATDAQNGVILDTVLAQAKATLHEFQESGGELPEPISSAWLEADHSNLLKKDYEIESKLDEEEFNFLRRILALPANIQGGIFQTDVQILQGLAIKLSRILKEVSGNLLTVQQGMDESLEALVTGEYCFVEKFFLLSDLLGSSFTSVPKPEFFQIVKFVTKASKSLLNGYQMLGGRPYTNISPSLQRLEAFLGQNKEADAKTETQIRSGVDMEAVKRELNGSVGKIMNFLQMPQEDTKKIVSDLKNLRSMQNPMDSGGDARKIRRAITKVYFAAYEKAFHKHRESKGNIPLPVKLMLQFGYFDDEFLDDSHKAFLYDLRDTTKGKPEYPILPVTDWLALVGEKKEPPSMDEMGQYFFDKLKMEHKDKGWKKENEVPEEYDNFNVRIKYEISNFLETNVRLTSGSPATAFPILTNYQITTGLDKAFVSREKLSDALQKLLEVDYGLFHREVLINDEQLNIQKEFVQTQVIPNFIVVPSIGTKVMMWQDLALPRLKSSRGRIAIPAFATADIFTLLLDAVGAFRWELTKTILGPDWNNIGNSSITADYTDYVQFYKKSRELSPEQKEKLAAEFKRFRDDRSRFINDYVNWIKYESDGVPKLNRVARAIFYRHVPFSKVVRDKICTQPAYADFHNRFTNIRNKKLRELEIRYKKYGEGPSLPDVLKRNIDFYKT